MKLILVLSVFLFAAPAFAVTYQWTDETGTVNFTEDLGNVPKKYRKKARILGGEDTTAPQVIELDAPGKEKAPADEGKKVKDDAASGKEKAAVYGDKTEAGWKSGYKKLSADVKAAEDQLDQLNSRLSDTSSMSRAEYLGLQHTIKNTQVRLDGARKKLDDYTAAATKAGVPNLMD